MTMSDALNALGQMELQRREHAAWLDAVQELVDRGIEPNDDEHEPLMAALKKWGEELHQLREHDPDTAHETTALREARAKYPRGQYERGTYPEAIRRG
jgi:hypothetical protein